MSSDASSDPRSAFTESLATLRARLAVQARTDELFQALEAELQSLDESSCSPDERTSTPMEKLKNEALAHIAALARFHCKYSTFLAHENQREIAHAWSVDEGYLRASFDLLNSVNVAIDAS